MDPVRNTLFIGGLWFNPEKASNLGDKLRQQASIQHLSLLGLDSLAEREDAVQRRIATHPEIDQIITHSAGCLPLAGILPEISTQVKTLILLNPAPLPGEKFGFFEPISKLTRKHLWKIIRGKKILPTFEEMKTVLGKDLRWEIYQDFKSDSGKFLRELIRLQYFAWKRALIVPREMKIITYLAGGNDLMLGDAQYNSAARWHGFKNHEGLQMAKAKGDARAQHLIAHALQPDCMSTQSHIHSLLNFRDTLQTLCCANGFTL